MLLQRNDLPLHTEPDPDSRYEFAKRPARPGPAWRVPPAPR